MRISVTTGVLAAAATLLLAGFGPPPGAVRLKLGLKPGSKFAYTVQTAQNMAMQSNSMIQNSTSGHTFVVQSAAAGSKTLGVTYSRIAMSVDAGGQKMAYDSQDPTTKDNMLSGIMGGMVGQSLSITVADGGEVTAVKGVEEIKKSVLAGSSSQAFAPQIEQSINENTIKGSMNQLFNIYPDHAVKPGESWVKNTSLNMGPATIKQASTYQLGSVQNGVAHLLVNGKLAADGAVNLSGTQTGTLDVDVATGLILTGKLQQTLASPTGASSMNIASDITITGQKL